MSGAFADTGTACRFEDVLFYAVAKSAIGECLVARSSIGVCAILFGDSSEQLREDLAAAFPVSTLLANELVVRGDLSKVLRLIERPATHLDMTLDMRGTPFQRRVWEKVKAVPPGRAVSYLELGRWIGPRVPPRAIEEACSANPLAIAIPCHRIVRDDLDPGSYRWGIALKRKLLEMERSCAPAAAATSVAEALPALRVCAYDWRSLTKDLDAHGSAVLPGLLGPEECRALSALYLDEKHFRSHVVMARHGFGRGEYRYFSYPLPDLVETLRTAIYPRLAGLANDWNERMGLSRRYPAEHAAFLSECRRAGQARPTPLLLKYEAGDYNCLHQDLYGELVFPIQMAILLSEPGADFTGGEFAVTEQRPRMQSRVEVVPLRQGDAVAFAVHSRPVRGSRGSYRVNLRHGVSRVRSGLRHTVGIIFHDAK